MKYHVSRDGKTRPCRSKGPCPLGTSFDNKGKADSYVVTKESQKDKYNKAIQSGENYSKEDAIERGKFVNETVSALLKSGMDTQSLHTNDEGKYNKKRAALHREILDKFHEKYESVPSEGKSVFSGGLPGAGKTTVLNLLEEGGAGGVNVDNYATVSSDDFKEEFAEKNMIPEVEGLTPMESSTLVHKESSYLADKFLSELSEKKKNIVYDFTCKDINSTTERMNILRNSGYEEKDMQFVFVDIPMEEAEKRAIGRYTYGLNAGIEAGKDGNHVGGRYLPPAILHRNKSLTGNYSSVNAETLIEVYERNKESGLPKPIVYDNSGDKFADPTYEPLRLDFDKFSNK